MWAFWVLFTLLVIRIEATLPELCKKCKCEDDILDCSSRNFTTHFEDSIWMGLAQHTVTFQNNSIVHLIPFPPMSLTRLSLRNNRITKIEDSTFRDLTNLTELDLSHNQLTSDNLTPNIFRGTFLPGLFEPLTMLKILRLSSNSLHTLHPNLLEHLPNLEALFLNSNPFKILDHSTLVALAIAPKLKVLDLSSMYLRELPESLLYVPKNLKILNISSNLFRKVPLALGEAHSLQTLVMDENPIVEINSFPEMETLEVLRINYMPNLVLIGAHALAHLPRLTELYCSYNPKLEEISKMALSTLPTNPEEGQVWPQLKKLDLSHNNLKYLDSELVSSWDLLETVNLSGNPWVCDCKNQWIVSILIPKLLSKNMSHTATLICRSPVEMESKEMVKLSQRKYEMRCLDYLGHQPEKDAAVLIAVLVGVLTAVPLSLLAIYLYRRILTPNINYSRAFYSKTNSVDSFS